MSYYRVDQTSPGQFHYHLDGPDGRPLLSGGPFANFESVCDAIEACRISSLFGSAFHRSTTRHGQFCFTLRSAYDKLIGSSQMHPTAAACEVAVALVRADASNSLIRERPSPEASGSSPTTPWTAIATPAMRGWGGQSMSARDS